jgi:hypothetical protein
MCVAQGVEHEEPPNSSLNLSRPGFGPALKRLG